MKNKHSIGSVWIKPTWEEEFDKKWIEIYMSDKSFEDFRQFLKSFISQVLKEEKKETLNKLRRWLRGRKICVHDKDLVRNWINFYQREYERR